ncbi:MAG: hypothetical protein H0U70_06245 [Tatlockia sp.]|nr:hypothetical protein [Tatlockia sp.]
MKIILLDFDDTFETEINGKIVYNEILIEKLIQAQKNGALVIGFTNWYSFNYKLGSVGRLLLIKGLEERGLNLDGMNTTWNFLNIYKLINDRKSEDQTLQSYLNTLNLNERLELLNSHYQQDIKRIEEENNFTQGKSESANQAAKALEALEKELKTLEEAAKTELKLGIYLEDGKEGKEQMFRAVFTLLGSEQEYIVLDDKSAVIKVAKALAENENINLHGFMVERMIEMKATQNAEVQEQFSYEEALTNPKQLTQTIASKKGKVTSKINTQLSNSKISPQTLGQYMTTNYSKILNKSQEELFAQEYNLTDLIEIDFSGVGNALSFTFGTIEAAEQFSFTMKMLYGENGRRYLKNNFPTNEMTNEVEIYGEMSNIVMDGLYFQIFKRKYFEHYNSSYFSNPYSNMKEMLEKNTVRNLETVIEYAKNNPNTRTAEVWNAMQNEENELPNRSPTFKTHISVISHSDHDSFIKGFGAINFPSSSQWDYANNNVHMLRYNTRNEGLKFQYNFYKGRNIYQNAEAVILLYQTREDLGILQAAYNAALSQNIPLILVFKYREEQAKDFENIKKLFPKAHPTLFTDKISNQQKSHLKEIFQKNIQPIVDRKVRELGLYTLGKKLIDERIGELEKELRGSFVFNDQVKRKKIIALQQISAGIDEATTENSFNHKSLEEIINSIRTNKKYQSIDQGYFSVTKKLLDSIIENEQANTLAMNSI